jgi:hypothetical protein
MDAHPIIYPLGNFDPYAGVRYRFELQRYRNADFWPLLPSQRTYAPKVLTCARLDVRTAMVALPALTTYGFTDPDAMRRKFGADTEKVFTQEREDLLAPDHLASFVAFQAWLRVNTAPCGPPGQPKINVRLHSNAIMRTAAGELGFISHGTVIAALHIEGYFIQQAEEREWGHPNWAETNVELSPDTWDRVMWRARMQRQHSLEHIAERARIEEERQLEERRRRDEAGINAMLAEFMALSPEQPESPPVRRTRRPPVKPRTRRVRRVKKEETVT